ncbi:hypothetical protein N2152v2_001609 [Parachlorella kessleri]
MPSVLQVEEAVVTNGASHAPVKAALAQSQQVLNKVPTQLLINGEWVDAVSGNTFPVLDPRTEQEIIHIAEADSADVDKAVAAARAAFDEGPWPRMGGAKRGRILNKLADLIEANADELAAIESLDNGKPLYMSKAADIPLTVACFRYYAGWTDKIHGKTIPTDSSHMVYTLHEPIGVVGQIIPWNFPLLMFAWKVAPALACGNTVVMKPAEQTPLTALRVGQLAIEAGLPAGVLNVLPGYGPTAGASICNHKGVDKLAFTGSTDIGRIIARAGAERLVPVSLELGGKSPLIVWKDADIDQAVELAHFALFFNHGQCCCAGSRLYVHADIYEEFCAKAAERARTRKVGDPFQEGVEQGPQVDKEQLNKILGYIEAGKQEGARMLCGGGRHGDRGYFVQPTVFADVTDDMKIAREEIFGPVQSILKFESLKEVVARANDSEYGLAAGVVAKDVNVINTLSRSLKAGTVWVNCYNCFDIAVPFGGYKSSGIGRDKGEYALECYTQVKAVYQALDEDQCWL